MNTVILIGRTTKETELRYTQNQTAVARFTVAVDRRDKDGGTDFISCVAFGKTAENMHKYVRKGNRVAVNGRIQTGSYTNKDGQKVYTTDIIANNVEFIESKPKEQREPPAQGKPSVYDGFTEIDDADLPF